MIAEGRNFLDDQPLGRPSCRARDRPDRARAQHARRRPARHLRPAAAAVVDGGTDPSGDVLDGGRPVRVDLLVVEGLTTEIRRRRGSFAAVDDVSFTVRRGEILGLVGESGCGKTMTALSLMRLLPPAADDRRRRGLARRAATCSRSASARCGASAATDVAMVFQEPMTALDPVVHRSARQIDRGRPRPRSAGTTRRREARAIEMLDRLGIPQRGAPARRLPAPVLRRHAPAGDARAGAGDEPEAAPRRRADDRARRHDPGPDPRPDRRSAATSSG